MSQPSPTNYVDCGRCGWSGREVGTLEAGGKTSMVVHDGERFLGVIALLIPSALFGLASIGIAIIFHEGSTLVVVANALRLLGYRGG